MLIFVKIFSRLRPLWPPEFYFITASLTRAVAEFTWNYRERLRDLSQHSSVSDNNRESLTSETPRPLSLKQETNDDATKLKRFTIKLEETTFNSFDI